jgi:hypothetical protein
LGTGHTSNFSNEGKGGAKYGGLDESLFKKQLVTCLLHRDRPLPFINPGRILEVDCLETLTGELGTSGNQAQLRGRTLHLQKVINSKSLSILNV